MSLTVPDDLVIVVVRNLVTQLDPQELPLFRATSQLFLQNPARLSTGQQARNDPAVFGVGDTAALLTPAALVVANAVISYLVGEITKAASNKRAAFRRERH